MNRLFQTSVLIASLLVLCSCETPLNKYLPVNETEKELVETLNMYLEARNSNDVRKLATLFDDDGQYIAGDGTTLRGREDIAKSDPVWWTQYGKQKIFNPKFHIEENKATVSIIGRWGMAHRRPQTFSLINSDGKWLISKAALDR